jgi:predicted nucleic acid-binding Zn ribbon protein
VKPFGRGRRRTSPQALGALVPTLLDDLGLEGMRKLTRILGCWEKIVGAEASRHVQPSVLRGHVLEAEVDASVWAQTLRLRSPAILAALAEELGAEAPTELWLRVGGGVSRPAQGPHGGASSGAR